MTPEQMFGVFQLFSMLCAVFNAFMTEGWSGKFGWIVSAMLFFSLGMSKLLGL